MDSPSDSTVLENITNTQENGEQSAEVQVTEKKKKKSTTKKSKKVKQAESLRLKAGEGKKIHVRSVDASQVQQKFNKVATDAENAAASLCKLCNKQVFQMERVKAERAVWHKNCFTCTECKKKLSVDNYNSHEGLLYCKPHFKQLFQPKAVLDSDEPYYSKPELIIRESQPIELPSDVVRASETSSSWGMEELCNLDLKSRFTMFERKQLQDDVETREEHKHVKRSESILSRLAKFDRENSGLKTEFSKSCSALDDSSSENEDPYAYEEGESNRISYHGPDGLTTFNPISDIKSKWEGSNGESPVSRREELAKQRKEELKLLRARQCQGRQLRLKEQYEQALQAGNDSKDGQAADANVVDPEKIKQIKNIFEKGGSEERMAASKVTEPVVNPEKLKQIKGLFEGGLERQSSVEKQEREEFFLGASTKEARNIFKQMEENGFQEKPKHKESYGLENRETFKSTSAMLDLFRRLEKEPDRFRDYRGEDDEEEYEEEEEGSEEEGTDDEQEEDENMTVGLTSQQQELLQIARDRAVARNMREKFERWEFSNDEEKAAYEKTLMIPESEELQTSLNTAKNLRAMFENLQKDPPKFEKPQIKVNRFV